MTTADLASIPFPEAADTWLETRRAYISAKAFHEYQVNIRTLSAFFGEMRLQEISADQIRAYQQMRRTQCGPFAINHECSVLQQMLKRIGRWPEIARDYQALPLPKEKRGRALAPEEKERLFKLSSTNPNWEATFLFATISVNTSAGPKETATLRLKDIDLERRLITVQPEGAKNVHRIRAIPLNDEAFKAVTFAMSRAKRLGALSPDHYLFPFRIHRALFDPTRHQTSLKGAWLRMAAADLSGFRMYDLRHHCVTALLENPRVSEETVESIVGHISREMKKRYSHVRMDARRKAVSGLDGSTPELSSEAADEMRPLRNEDVLEMLSGLSPRIVAEQVKSSVGNFDTSPAALKELQAKGVPEAVILAMFHAKKRKSV